jgi:SAM-dependent methyltransferase
VPDDPIEAARDRLIAAFPFRGYVEAGVDSYRAIARIVMQHLPAGARVLDFGSGPCDKVGMLAELGYRCAAIDDLSDPWHRQGSNRELIETFAREAGIDLRVTDDPAAATWAEPFDMVMIHDVLEHWHDSPRDLLNLLLERLAEGGLLFVTVPNAANGRKRLAVLRGRTNHPPFEQYFWAEGSWRGHVREYVRSDLALLADYLGLDVLLLEPRTHLIAQVPARVRPLYRVLARIAPGIQDSWLLLARKPASWTPRDRPASDIARIATIGTPLAERDR